MRYHYAGQMVQFAPEYSIAFQLKYSKYQEELEDEKYAPLQRII